MWCVFDNDSGAALRGANPRACFSIAMKMRWTNFTIEKGERLKSAERAAAMKSGRQNKGGGAACELAK